jgi:hypothetical protein
VARLGKSVARTLARRGADHRRARHGILDRYRRFVVDGVPVATGIVSVGDSWACTNPSLGRGIAMGLMHALGTMEVVGQHLDNPLALALAQDSMTETRVTPFTEQAFAFCKQKNDPARYRLLETICSVRARMRRPQFAFAHINSNAG